MLTVSLFYDSYSHYPGGVHNPIKTELTFANRIPWWLKDSKRLPPMQETQFWSLGWEDPLEKEMIAHSSILAWRIPWTEERGRLQATGSQRVGHDWATSLTHLLTQ